VAGGASLSSAWLRGVGLQHGDGGDGLLGHVVAGDAGFDEQLARLGHRRAADPAADQRQRRLPSSGRMAGSRARAMSVEGTMAVGAWMNSTVPLSCGVARQRGSASA
jgi:hypothetical protein